MNLVVATDAVTHDSRDLLYSSDMISSTLLYIPCNTVIKSVAPCFVLFERLNRNSSHLFFAMQNNLNFLICKVANRLRERGNGVRCFVWFLHFALCFD